MVITHSRMIGWSSIFIMLALVLASGPAFADPPPVERQTQLAGNSLANYPYFEFVKAFNEDATVEVAVDIARFTELNGQTADIYVTEAKTEEQWIADPGLTDVTGGALTVTFSGSTIQENTFSAAGASTLNADAGLGLGVGYDVVIDVDQNGMLTDVDYIDGLGNEAGLYAVHDTTQAGPLAVTEITYSGGSWLGQDTYYPTDIASMGQLPLVVISHGNGHNYQWYDHIGFHLASYGFVVMSHENETGPGIETASTTTLTNTDYIIANQATIGGGVLNGHIDERAITWIGHSRGAEGITRAYDRLFDDAYTPTHYTIEDVILLSSMLPTDFLGTNNSDPHDANYHLWTAAGDSDVSGTASNDIAQTFHLHDRATAFRQSTVVQGTGHGWFHDGGGSAWFTGPCEIGEENTHLIQQGYFLPLVMHYIQGNIPARDFLWRQYEHFHPIGVDTSDPCIVVTHEHRNGADAGNFFIDDFQSESSTSISSSGGAVTYTVENLTEGQLNDNNSSFSWTASDPFNGATQARTSDTTDGVVFDWTGSNRYIEWEVIPSEQDFSDDLYLSFRGAQGTQHPNTLAVMGDVTFSVTLLDGSGSASSINIGAYGGGLEQPYDRSGGWHNEMEVVKIRLSDFLHNGSGLDLTNIEAVRFDCGPSWGSDEGRIVVDELMLTNDAFPEIPGGFQYPKLTLTVNGSTGPVTIIDGSGEFVIEMDFLARGGMGFNAEVYLVMQRMAGGWWSYDGSWGNGRNHEYYVGPLTDLNETLGDILGPIVPGDYTAHLVLDTSPDGVLNRPYDVESVEVSVLPAGTEIILICDFAGASGQAQADALAALGYGYEMVASLPSDLGMYSAVFVDLGIFGFGNHVLTTSEGDILADYMDAGGPVYMEGGDTWYYDTQTAAHGYFGITGVSDGGSDTFSCVGVSGTFTDGMDFAYTGNNSWMDQLSAVSPAYSIFEEGSAGYVNGIVDGTYKTIGCSYDFGGLVDGSSPSTQMELMAYYVAFMGL